MSGVLALPGYEDATENINCFGPKPWGGADVGQGWGSPRWGCSGPLRHHYMKVGTGGRCFSKKQASDFIKKMPTVRQKVHEREKQTKKKKKGKTRHP